MRAAVKEDDHNASITKENRKQCGQPLKTMNTMLASQKKTESNADSR